MRHASPQPPPARGPPVAPGHVGGSPGLVDEDQPFGIEIELALEPGLAPFANVGPVLLGGMRRLFFTRDLVPAAEAPERAHAHEGSFLGQARLQLGQGDVGHLVQGRVDQLGMGLGSTREPVAALRLGPGIPPRSAHPPPTDPPRRLGASPANGSRWRRSRRTGPPPGGMIGPRRWRPEHESEGRRTALWAYRPVSFASRCPESDRPRFAYPGRL